MSDPSEGLVFTDMEYTKLFMRNSSEASSMND